MEIVASEQKRSEAEAKMRILDAVITSYKTPAEIEANLRNENAFNLRVEADVEAEATLVGRGKAEKSWARELVGRTRGGCCC